MKIPGSKEYVDLEVPGVSNLQKLYSNTANTHIQRPIEAAIIIQKFFRMKMAQRYVKQIIERRTKQDDEDYGFFEN